MGDLEYWHILKGMSQEPYPLIQLKGGQVFPAYKDSSASLRKCEIVLTGFGKSVKDGEEDWVAKRGIDKWYGGVHLQGCSPRWRWDSLLQLVRGSGCNG